MAEGSAQTLCFAQSLFVKEIPDLEIIGLRSGCAANLRSENNLTLDT